MKQTSQAIALLIASVSADVTNTIATGYQTGTANWTAVQTAAGTTNRTAMQSRTAPYAFRNTGTWTFSTPVINKAILANDYAPLTSTKNIMDTGIATTTGLGSTCVACIGGGAVWCSRTYNFVITTVTTYQQEATTYSAGILGVLSTTDASTWTATTASDQGTCCNTNALFVELIGKQATAASPTNWTFGASASAGATGSNVTGGNAGTSTTCVSIANLSMVALAGSTNASWGAGTLETSKTGFTSWWCSNGLYKKVTQVATTAAITTNFTQTLGQADNQRLDLALVGCPMIIGKCGGTSAGSGITTLTATQIASATPVTILVPKTQTATGELALTMNDKCTWIATSLTYAPTFAMGVGTGSLAGLGLTSVNWQIHHMEYTANTATQTAFEPANGALIYQAATTTVGEQQPGQALNFGWAPKFDMPAAQFATLRTWYSTSIGTTNNLVGNTATASVYGGQAASWFNPYSNGSSTVNVSAANAFLAAMNTTQQFGNVANIANAGITNNSTATNLTASQNYGINGSVYFDFRQVRYMPAQAAQTVWAAGNALNTAYTAQTTAYATAKTTWNAYVAILKKNAKMDAFAAAFSPPKAPTVPPLPNMPWTPAAYSGYLKQTPYQNALMLGNQSMAAAYVEASQPTSQQFWTSLDAAQTIGGWGSFTAQVLQFRDGWGKSFGTIGYGPGTQSMSQVWSSAQMCGTSAAVTAASTSTACDKLYAVSANATSLTAGTTIVNNTFTFVTVVSLWSVGNTDSASGNLGVWAANSSLSITWTSGNWSNTLQALSAISAPAAPTAADSLTGVAGASALAASSAAVLAIAALY